MIIYYYPTPSAWWHDIKCKFNFWRIIFFTLHQTNSLQLLTWKETVETNNCVFKKCYIIPRPRKRSHESNYSRTCKFLTSCRRGSTAVLKKSTCSHWESHTSPWVGSAVDGLTRRNINLWDLSTIKSSNSSQFNTSAPLSVEHPLLSTFIHSEILQVSPPHTFFFPFEDFWALPRTP